MSNFVQRVYDWIDSRKTPKWLKELLGELQLIMWDILKMSGKMYISKIEQLIVEAGYKKDWSNQEKFKYVFDGARNSGIKAVIELKDNELNTLINFLYSKMKAQLSV